MGEQQEANILEKNQEDHASVPAAEPTHLFSMLHLTSGSCPRHPPCSAANPMKRRSPSSSYGEPSAKKPFCDQDDLSHRGFSAVHVPLNINPLLTKGRSSAVLRRCVSDPNRPPEPPRASGLPPLPPRFRRSVSDLSPSPLPCLSCEETATPDSVRLRTVKDRLKEMRQFGMKLSKMMEEKKSVQCPETTEFCFRMIREKKIMKMLVLSGLKSA
ncbi:hypothetical protein Fmac_000904 [Flemingia macrophylla]|uniref:Uncharacterized protein n=1 Tax=Flemingia macrophylla TaxID=520843 RepID=A0ABD1NFL7_9FABA